MKITDIVYTADGASGVLRGEGVEIPIEVKLSALELSQAEKRGKAIAVSKANRYLRNQRKAMRDGVSGDVGFGFIRKAWRKVKRKAKRFVDKTTPKFVKKIVKRAARTKLGRFAVKMAKKGIRFGRKVGDLAERVAMHPAFQATVFAISQAVPGAQGLGYAYIAGMAAIRVANKIADGDKSAVGDLARYGALAAQGNPQAAEFMNNFNRIQSVVSAASGPSQGRAGRIASSVSDVPGLGRVSKESKATLELLSNLTQKGVTGENATEMLDAFKGLAKGGNKKAATVVNIFDDIANIAKTKPDLDAIAVQVAQNKLANPKAA